VNGTQQFKATGYYSDGTTVDLTYQCTWNSSNTAIASYATTEIGAFKGVASGTATITATQGSSLSGQATIKVLPYAPSDLQGSWNLMVFNTGPDVTAGTYPGWIRENISVDANGEITFSSFLDSSSNTTPPTDTLILTINTSTGAITETTNGEQDTLHGWISSDKTIFFAVSSPGNDRQIYIAVNQNGTTFSSTDISSLNFVYHTIMSGKSSDWSYGDGSIDGSQQLTVSSCTESSGSCTTPTATTLSIDSTGIVTSSIDSKWQGVMTPDKETIFITQGDGTTNATTLMVMQVTGSQTYVQSDAAGTWHQGSINNASSTSSAEWDYATVSIDNSGIMTWSSWLDSTGSTTLPQSATISLSSNGTITFPSISSANGTMSVNKNMIIMTMTSSESGSNQLGILMK
jgi:hypothetical protein